jgi:hypothetical protein
MIEQAIQTKVFEVFSITRPDTVFECYGKLVYNLFSSSKKEPKLTSIENLIIDALVNNGKNRGDKKVQNSVLRDPFRPVQLFSRINGKLHFNLSAGLKTLRDHLTVLEGPPIVDLFEQTIVAVWQNKAAFLDKLNQYIFQPNRSLIEGLAVFTLFLSRYIQPKSVFFMTEFLLVLLHLAFRLQHTHFRVQKFILSETSEHKDLVVQSERRMLVILGNSRETRLECELVFRVFRDYLVSNGFLLAVA